MSQLEVTVPEALEGVRVDKAVALLADRTRSAVADLVERGRVSVDGRPVRSRSSALRAGQHLTVDLDQEVAPGPLADPSVPVEVVFADDALIVVDKPAGLVVHPGAGQPTGTLVHGLLARFPELSSVGEADRPGIVHRLDRGTSGLLVVARTPAAYGSLVAQLSSRTVTRRYRAVVHGAVEAASGVIDAPVGRSGSAPTRMAVTRRGRPARTRYRVEARFDRPVPTTLLTVELETGRTHQIRVHLAAIGHPVLGDDVYGAGRGGPTPITRPFLHAERLELVHPVTGEHRSWTSELPAELRALLAQFAE